jgi:hypothetical protein
LDHTPATVAFQSREDILPALKKGASHRSPSTPVTGTGRSIILFEKRFMKSKNKNYFLVRFTHSIAASPAQTEVSTVDKEIGE